MSIDVKPGNPPSPTIPEPGHIHMKLEVQIIPVSDVDRSKGFYEVLGLRLSTTTSLRSTRPHRPIHTARLGDLGHVRQGTHNGPTGLGRGITGRVRHRGGP